MTRATKIVATVGLASSGFDLFEQMILAGVDVFRLNFSRGSASHHLSQAQTIRVAAKSVGREVGIVADLQGLKIRIGKFIGDRVRLDHFRINAQHVG